MKSLLEACMYCSKLRFQILVSGLTSESCSAEAEIAPEQNFQILLVRYFVILKSLLEPYF